MRFTYILIFLIAGLTISATEAGSTTPEVVLSSNSMGRGDVVLISIKSGRGEKPRITWMDKEISLVFNPRGPSWQGFIPADLNQKEGVFKAFLEILPYGFTRDIDIRVTDKDYGVRRLTLPREMVELDQETLKRVNNESEIVNALWTAEVLTPLWEGNFIMPVEGDVVGSFGKKSIINEQERSPHTGVDLRGNTGDPVKAVNNGTVVLTADHFFTGNCLYLDHGGGIISMYFHLDRILVKEGDRVEKGQVIALVGSTGRATGPHLHFGIRVNGERVNPLTLIELSKGLEE